MESIGFAWGTSNPQALSEQEVEVEDELAGTLGKFGVSFAKHRKKRIAYLDGWPHRMILTLGEKQQARDTTKLFQTDAIIYDQLVDVEQPPRILASYIRRSPFKTLRARQLKVGLQQSHFESTERFLKHVDDSTACVVSSNVVEDFINYQKNASQDNSWGSRYRRPQTALGATSNAQLLDTAHKYKPPSSAAPIDYNIGILEKDDIAPLSKGSMDFAAVEQGGATSPYWICSAEGVGVPTADLHVLRTVVPYGKDYLLGKIWCG